jgi:hypothetical protein
MSVGAYRNHPVEIHRVVSIAHIDFKFVKPTTIVIIYLFG